MSNQLCMYPPVKFSRFWKLQLHYLKYIWLVNVNIVLYPFVCRRLQESDQQNRELMAIAGKKEETIQKLQVNTTNQCI